MLKKTILPGLAAKAHYILHWSWKTEDFLLKRWSKDYTIMTRITLCSQRLREGTHQLYIPKDKRILHKRKMNGWCIYSLFSELLSKPQVIQCFSRCSTPTSFLPIGYDLYTTEDTCEPGLHPRMPIFKLWNLYQANESKPRSSSAMWSSGLIRWTKGILISLLR